MLRFSLSTRSGYMKEAKSSVEVRDGEGHLRALSFPLEPDILATAGDQDIGRLEDPPPLPRF